MQFCELQCAEPRSTNVKNGAAEGGVCQITDHINERPLALKSQPCTNILSLRGLELPPCRCGGKSVSSLGESESGREVVC